MSSAILVFTGHHPEAKGSVAPDGRHEHDIVYDVFTWRLQEALRILGMPGTNVPRFPGATIPHKAAYAAEYSHPLRRVRLALDLHLNWSEDKTAKGLWICHHDTASAALKASAKTLATRLCGKVFQLDDDRDGFAEHMEKVGIPALVIELAFISNPTDLATAEREAGERMIDIARALLQTFPPGP